MTLQNASSRARHALRCLNVGDAFGQRFFFMEPAELVDRLTQQELPQGPWPYTDDSEMADVLVRHLEEHGTVQQGALGAAFATAMSVERGYGAGASRILGGIAEGGDWRTLTRTAFGGVGSFGNGAAMRVAPLGAWFADQSITTVAEQARLSAEVTHAHPEGVAGAIAVAVATAAIIQGTDLFATVLEHLPKGYVREGVEQARGLRSDTRVVDAAVVLGNGSGVSAPDTVPLCLWVAARGLPFEQSLWHTVSALGDRDTTCAIVGGLLAGRVASIPQEWVERTERVPGLGE